MTVADGKLYVPARPLAIQMIIGKEWGLAVNENPLQAALAALKDAARSGANVFAVLMDAARVCGLQQITEAFFEVGGQYRRNV